MQSSHHITREITADMIYDALNHKMKIMSAAVVKEKLSTGEYLQIDGKIIPASIVLAEGGGSSN